MATSRSVSLDILRARVASEMYVDPSGVVMGTKQVTTHLDRTQAKVKQTVDQFGYLHLSLKRIATYSAIFTFFGGMARLLGQVTELQLRQAEVSTLVDTRNRDMARSFEFVKNAVLDIDPHLGNAIDLTKGLYEIMSAGVNDPVEALELLELSAKYAKVGLTDLATASSTATAVMKAYGLQASDMREKLDVMFGAVQEGKFHTYELNEALGKVIPTAATMGVSIDEVVMALAVLSQRGLDANQAATALNRMFLAFMKPLDKTQAAFNKLGIEWGRDAFAAKSFGEVMAVIKDGMERYGDLLPQIFTRQRGLRGAFILTGQGLDDYNRMLADTARLTEGVGEVERGAQKIKRTLASEIKAMQAEILKTASAWMHYSATAGAVVRIAKETVIAIMKMPLGLAAMAVGITRVNQLMRAQAIELNNILSLQRPLILMRQRYMVLTAEEAALYSQLEVARTAALKNMRRIAIMRVGYLAVIAALMLLNNAITRLGEKLRAQIQELVAYGEELYKVRREAGALGDLMEEAGIGVESDVHKRANELGRAYMMEILRGMRDASKGKGKTFFGLFEVEQEWSALYRKIYKAALQRDPRQARALSGEIRELAKALAEGTTFTEQHSRTVSLLANVWNLGVKSLARANDELSRSAELGPVVEKYNRQYLLIIRDLNDAVQEGLPESLAELYDVDKLEGMRNALQQAFSPELSKYVRDRLEEWGFDFEKYGDKVEVISKNITEAIGIRKKMEWTRGIEEFTRAFTQSLDEIAPGEDKIKQMSQGMVNAWEQYGERGITSIKLFVKHNRKYLEVLKANWHLVPDELKQALSKFTATLDSEGKKALRAREKALEGVESWGSDMKSVLSDITQFENKLNEEKYKNVSVRTAEENRKQKEKLDEQLAEFEKYYGVSLWMRSAYYAQLAAMQKKQLLADRVAEMDRILEIRRTNKELLGSQYEYNFQRLKAAKKYYAEEIKMIEESKILSEQDKAERLKSAKTFWEAVIKAIENAKTATEKYIAVLKVFGNFFSRMSDSLRYMFDALGAEGGFAMKLVEITDTMGRAFLNISGAISDAERAMNSWDSEADNFISKLGKVATVADAVVTIVTSLITVIAKLFGGKSEEQKQAEENERKARELEQMAERFKIYTRNWYGEISDSLAKAMAELQQEGMAGWTVQMKMFDRIMSDVGVNVDNFLQFAKDLKSVLHAVGDGLLKDYEAAEVFGKSFKQLVDYAREHGVEGHKSLLELIRLTKELGIEVAEVSEYIDEQLKRAAEGLANAIIWLAKDAVEASDEIKDLTREKRKLLREVERLQKQMEKYGFGSSEYREAQEEVDKLLKEIKRLDNQIAKFQQTIDDTSNRTKRSLKDLGIVVAGTFNAMLAEGKPMHEVLVAMQDSVFALIERYRALGMDVPSYLRPIFQVFKEFKKHPEFFEGFQGLLDIFQGLGNTGHLTADMFQALTREAKRYYKTLTDTDGLGLPDETAIQMMYPLLQKMWWYAEQNNLELPKWAQRAIDEMERAGYKFEPPLENQQLDLITNIDALALQRNDILTEMNKNIMKTNDLLGASYQSGNPYIAKSHVARLHPGESVVPANLSDAMRQFFTGTYGGGVGTGGGATTLVVNLDGRQVYKGLVPHLREGGRYGDFELSGQGVN